MVKEATVLSTPNEALTTIPVGTEDLLSVRDDFERCREVYKTFAELAKKQVEGSVDAAELFEGVQAELEEFVRIIQGRIVRITDSIKQKPGSWRQEGNTYSCNYVGPFGTPIVLEREIYEQGTFDDGIDTLLLRNMGTDASLVFSAERLDSGGTRYVFSGAQPVPSLNVTREINFTIERGEETVLIKGDDRMLPSRRLTLSPFTGSSFRLHVKGQIVQQDLVPNPL